MGKGATHKDTAEHVAKLRAEIQRHDRLYHVESRPEISDAVYQKLFGVLG